MLRAVVLLVLTFTSAAFAGPQMAAFDREGSICTATIEQPKPRKLAKGAWPQISPDGARVAFNTEGGDKDVRRFIAVSDLATGKITLFKDVPSDNCYGPVWSPDGKQIAFYIYKGDEWHIGLVDADGTHFRYFWKSDKKNHTLWSIAWAQDGQSFFAEDLDTIYRVGLDGKTLAQWSVEKTFPRGGLSSGSHLAPSPDGKSLLVDVDMDENVTREDWDGPPPSIWQLDLATGKATRISKPDQYLWEPAWINDREILCNGLPAGSKTFSLFRLPAAGGKPALWVKNARSASVSSK
jgi:TolB protein